MTKATITGFFNPRTKGDTFKGLNDSIKGTVAPDIIQGVHDFLKAAGRDYFIQKVPAFDYSPTGAVDAAGNIVPGFVEIENQFHLRRSTDFRIVSPHTVSDQYAALSLMDVADEIKPWCDQGWTTPDGVYDRNGSLEILSMRLDAGGDLADEKLLHYIIFQNPHGVGGKAKGKIITWRIICANTFARAVSADFDFEISHRVAGGDPEEQQRIMNERLQNSFAAWNKAKEHIAALAKRIDAQKSKAMSALEAEMLTDSLLGIAGPGEPRREISTRTENKKTAILRAFELPAAGTYGKTAFDWINAVTYVNSSPAAAEAAKSKVDPLDRLVRNVTPNGTGFMFEGKAQKLVAEFVGG